MAVFDIFFGPLVTVFAIVVSTLLLSLWYSIRKQSYWKERNVPYVKPLPFVGNLLDIMKKPFSDILLERHFSLGPVHGHFEGDRPVLTVADPKLLRDIFVKDFVHFQNRKTFKTGNKIRDKMLVFLTGEDWKRVRSIITPAFTTGKLKRILNIFEDCSQTLVQNFKASAMKNEPINAKRFLGAFTMDVIASSAFSTKLDSHSDPENTFVQNARKGFKNRLNWKVFIFLLWPNIIRFLKINTSSRSVTDFFSDATSQIIAERRKNKQTRNDFLQLLMDAADETTMKAKKGDAEDDDITTNYGEDFSNKTVSNSAFQKSLTMDELVAQCVIFFLAGYETTGSLLTYVLYCLATNTDVQEKAFQEIAQHLRETNGELKYEVLHNLKYLDNIISETLRMYPPAVRTERKVESDCKLGDISLTKDVIVMIPIFALHRDPKYYPNPEKFDPDRFSSEERAKRDPYVYLPFGHGNRNCIGMRFALLETKVCLVHIISCFNIKTCSQTKIPLEFDPKSFNLLQAKDVTVALEIRKDCPLKS